MNRVKIKSYAKVNLTLEIVGVEGGYHLLDSLVASVDLFDLVVVKKRKGKLSSVTMKGMGSESIPPEKNNALKAAEAFSERFGCDGAEITVYKNIPIGGGLGGSSADVVGVLNGMAQLYGIEDRAALKALADELGSDTGYMLDGGFARMQGRGEKVTPLPNFGKLYFLLVCPNSSVSAKACYQKYDELPKTLEWKESQTGACIKALMKRDLNEAGRYLMNDLYVPAIHVNNEVQKAYEAAASFSPLGTVMTGSGSGVLAMFEHKELCEWAQSRYKGKGRAYVVETVVPDYTAKKKKTGGWRNPFVLSEEEKELSGEE
ncbi:MAG: 4-(cytidine 5'-diphospho)-2-C-methyl-D-erythritol kinase [Clostridia bacterium]|nr:4-(cytidine 5'-diphospho)-2-C-methyl-D-erythritol kinase [Clostridia bacterium]